MTMSGEDDKNNAIGRYAAGSDKIDNMILSRKFYLLQTIQTIALLSNLF